MKQVPIYTLANFDVGAPNEDGLFALVLNYAPTPGKQAKNEFETYWIALEKNIARDMANALLKRIEEIEARQ